MNIFNRREICTSFSFDEQASICELMNKNGIETLVCSGSATNPGRSHGIPFIDAKQACEYKIYVHYSKLNAAMLLLRSYHN